MTDAISRQAAIDLLKQMRKDGDMIPWEGKDVFAKIRKLPPAEPKSGKWIYQNGMIKCDQCLRTIRRIDHDGLLNFCPNCGADMRGEQE